MSKHNRNVIAAAKTWRPYDYGFTMDVFAAMLEEMLDFYTKGKGVVQADESRNEIKAQLERALRLYHQAVDFENEEFDRWEAFCKKKAADWGAIPTAEREAFQKAEARAVQAHYDAFFLYVSQHFREWWD